MRPAQFLSSVVATSVVALSLGVPALAAPPDEPIAPPTDAPVTAPPVEAQQSDHMKDNAIWRSIKVRWDWTMPRGVPQGNAADIPNTPLQPVPGYQKAGNARYGPLPAGANGRYQVVLDASATTIKGERDGLVCRWAIAAPTPVRVSGPCAKSQSVQLPEGTWDLQLSAVDRPSGIVKTVTSEIEVDNVLMAVMGDSYAAGEGYPPFTNPDGTIKWDEPACDRSRWSGFVRAAVQMEDADPRSNVTLIDVACSGAQILEQSANPGVTPTGGMLTPQKKIKQPSQKSNTGPGDYMPAQVDQLNAIAQGKTWDVTLFSIGGNDAGLSPIVQSCLLTDTGSVMLAGVFEALTQTPNTPTANCNEAGQAEITLNFTDPSKITAECVGTTETEFAAKLLEIYLASCTTVPGYKPLWEVANENLTLLDNDNDKLLAPCLGSTGGAPQCQTKKIVNNAPAADFTPSKPIKVTDMRDVAQAMYPDLTQKPDGSGGTEFCGVQQDPTQPWGGQIVVGDPPIDFTKWKLGPNPLQNQLMSPMNEIDNTWAHGALYEGVAGEPIDLPLPTNDTVPVWQTNADNPIIPTADGLKTQILKDSGLYGWRAAMSMYDKSHPHGLCAQNRWVTNMTDYILGAVKYKGTGIGLHPNEAGYEAYGDMLGPLGVDMAGLPVVPAATKVVPRKPAAKTTTKASVRSKVVRPGERIVVGVQVTSPAGTPRGRITMTGNKSTTTSLLRASAKLSKQGRAVVKLPRKWSTLGPRQDRARIRISTRYEGTIDYHASKARDVVVTIKRGAASAPGRG